MLKKKRVNKRHSTTSIAYLITDINACIMIFIAIILAIMLYTYNPNDAGFYLYNGLSVSNDFGVVGAYIADFMLYMFGFSAWLVVIGLLYLGYCKINSTILLNTWSWSLRTVSFMILLINSSILEKLFFQHINTLYLHCGYGGKIGELCNYISYYVGTVGTAISCLFIFIMLACFTFNTSVVSMFEKINTAIYKLYAAIKFIIYNTKIIYTKLSKKSLHIKLHLSKIFDRFNFSQHKIVHDQSICEHYDELIEDLDDDNIVVNDTEIVDNNIDMYEISAVNNESRLPDLSLLSKHNFVKQIIPEDIRRRTNLIESKLKEFHVNAKVVDAQVGPIVTRYEILPAHGVRGDKVVNLSKELARGLSLRSIRIVENIAGKNTMAIEVPNVNRATIYLHDILDSTSYKKNNARLPLGLGKDVAGKVVVADLSKMPHLLVSGTTGSGKSVSLNAMIISILYYFAHNELKMIMIDPKVVELSCYDGIPHLLTPVITDPVKSVNALKWCVYEMERRYNLMAEFRIKNLDIFNEKAAMNSVDKLPYIIIIIDELADLMLSSDKKVEQYIVRIAQKARAVGMHLIIATQRPTVDVITGLIKANVPARIAFQATSKIDSRSILGQGGAESLLGRGDMLYLPAGAGQPIRVHGAYIDDDELANIVNWLKNIAEPEYIDDITNITQNNQVYGNEDLDDEMQVMLEFMHSSKRCSISALQTRFGIGYPKAARIMSIFEEKGLVKRNERGGFLLVKKD